MVLGFCGQFYGWVCWFLWQRGSEKEISKKLNNVWLRCKKNKRIDAE